MRLFRRQRRLNADIYWSGIQDLQERIYDLHVQLVAMQQDLARLGTIQATTEQTGRYLAEQEWQRNAATAGAEWPKLQLEADPPPETERERVERLRKKWEQAREKRGHTE